MTATLPSAGSKLTGLGELDGFAALRALQDDRTAVTLEQAATSPFYRHRFPDGLPTELGDLTVVPLTSKDDLRACYPFGMLGVPREELATYHESSGSSGAPTPSYYTEQEWDELGDRFNRKGIELSASDTLMIRIPYAMVMVAHLAQRGAALRGATVVPGDCRSLAAPYAQMVRVMHDIGVTVTWSTPSETLMLAAAAGLAGYDTTRDFPALRALYVAGEPMSRARKARIEQVWNRPVVEEYGCTEMGPMGGSCPYGRMHFFADRVLPEVLDPDTGVISREGVGRLVVTPLYRQGMPLLRYDLEDLVEIRHEDCQCGWYLPTVRVLGRIMHTYTIDDKAISPVSVEEAVFRLPAEHGVFFWRAKVTDDRLVVQVEANPTYADAACAALPGLIADVLDVPADVSAVPPGTLVPHSLIGGNRDAMKPRKLFAADEDWDAAIPRS